jgi:hypothetical protein
VYPARVEKHLVVAVTEGGKLLYELPIPSGREVAIGSDSDCVLPLTVSGGETLARVTLFVPDGPRHRLRVTETTKARVKLGDGRVLTTPELIESGAAQAIEQGWELPLDEHSVGYVEIAGHKVLFKYDGSG